MNIANLIGRISDKVFADSICEHKGNLKKKKLVYTSFDGDYMNFLPHMLTLAMTNDYIPVNPESALGYYVSTTTHDGSKIPVMKDCIQTELMCDEMWIMNPATEHIPEGVLTEMMVWLKHKKTSIRIIPFVDGHDLIIAPETILTEQNSKVFTIDDMTSHINSQNSKDVDEINAKLLSDEMHLPSSAYVVANFFNYKHIDWARAFCYLNNYCPVSPQNIIPY